ncbi:PAS domain S-box protein [Sphingomonas xanthus]|uniref:histidine kinase n=1 Tax=Sphingomonas xanthus TaxID=2594473 RepID=A0A516IP36_9SPHN|nr:PAS domain S-box protein [Sphingomonas xanthus]QDP18544.1 PAS domain S-box protein [Sphingomonas xanthus]
MSNLEFLPAEGEMAGRVRNFDWSKTPLGAIDSWPQSLKTATAILLNSPVPIVMLWGEDGVMIYNDAYSVFASARHPGLLGSKVREGWPEVADFNDNVMKVCLAGGTLAYKDQELTLHRHGRPEQVWMNLDYSPVPDETGRPAGVIAIVVETTERVLAERQTVAERERLKQMFEQAPGFMAVLRGPEHVFELANPAYMQLLGHREVIGKAAREAVPEVADQGFFEILDDVYRTGKAFIGSAVDVGLQRTPDGPTEHRVVDFVFQPITDNQGQVSGIFIEGSDVTERARADALRAAQSQMLELAVRDAPLDQLLDTLLRTVEAQSPFGMLGSVLLLEPDGIHLRHGAAPSLPDAYNQAIDGIEIGPEVGSCGTAAFHKTPVYVADIATDPLWTEFSDLALAHDLRACWSTPILSGQGEVLGTFAMYYREPREPMPADLEVIEIVTRSAALVIERTIAEQALQESEARLREKAAEFQMLAENVSQLAWMAEADGSIFWYNKRWYDYTGTDFESMQGWGWREVHHPDHIDRVIEEVQRNWAAGEPWEGTYLLRSASGEYRWFLTRAEPIRNEDGELIRWFGTNTDISAQQKAETALRESEERLRLVLDAAAGAFYSVDREGKTTLVSNGFLTMMGFSSEEEVIGRKLHDLIHHTHPDGSHYAVEQCPIYRCASTGESAHISDELFYRLDGSPVPVEYWVSPFMRDGEHIGAICTILDVTERKRSEAALRETEERYRLASRATNDAIWDWDLVRDHVQWNEAVHTMFGYSEDGVEPTGTWWLEHIHPEDRERVEESIHAVIDGGDSHWTEEYRFLTSDGGHVHVLDRGFVLRDAQGRAVRMIGAMLDLTERRRAEEALRELNETLERRVAEVIAEREQAEEALRQSQKMEAVGQLTGGIAHDFNNLLTIITGNVDMARRSLAGGEKARAGRALDNAQKGADRAAALTQRLLAFSRRQPLEPKPINVDKLVTGMAELLHRSLGETVKLETVSNPGLWLVEVDPNQLESAILNLAVNARDAMPGGGRLTIETANAYLDEEYSSAHAEVTSGSYVVIAVSDTGHGMSKKTLAQVFDPFFTTKEVGKGTGLGLSMVYGFVKQSGGHVTVYSEEGQGTTIKIYLPRLMSGKEAELAPSSLEADLPSREHTILVVEDDDDVRAYSVEILRELGYRVLEAHDGPSALRLIERQDTQIDLLFTDVVMPTMSGRELADLARSHQRNLKVLYTSGYTRNAIVHGGRLDLGVEMIAKPFTYQGLARKIRDVLDAGKTGRVLVVEADSTARMFAIEVLDDAGYAIDEAANASEALNRVRAAQGRYDAIILDVALPEKRGDALAVELRANYADLPILLVCGEHAAELRARFAEDKCIGVAGKPYTAAKLQQALSALGVSCVSRKS